MFLTSGGRFERKGGISGARRASFVASSAGCGADGADLARKPGRLHLPHRSKLVSTRG